MQRSITDAATVLDYTITRYQSYSGTYVADANGLGFELHTPCYMIGAGKFYWFLLILRTDMSMI